MIDWKVSTIIHIGYLQQGRHREYYFLRKTDSARYQWEKAQERTENFSKDEPLPIIADSVEEAIRLAYLQWHSPPLQSLICGFRFTLPERDEIGVPALFHQMRRSYSVGNGAYLDEEIGCSCIIHDAPSQTLALWRLLEKGESLS